MEDSVAITEEDIKRYYDLNKQKKVIDQEINQLKKTFHHILDHSIGKGKKGELQRGNYLVQRQIRSSINYLEDKTIQKLEELNLSDFINLVKRADTDKLEAAMKIGFVEEKEFDDCKTERLTQAIVVKEAF